MVHKWSMPDILYNLNLVVSPMEFLKADEFARYGTPRTERGESTDIMRV